MVPGDLPAVAMLEANCPSSWTLEQVEAEFDRQTGLALVAISFAGEVLGWCCGFQVGPDAELLKISVSPQWRRQGIAEALLQELCRCFAAGLGEKIYLEVRAKNLPALQLYSKLGWAEVGCRKKYYNDPADDALVFAGTLNE